MDICKMIPNSIEVVLENSSSPLPIYHEIIRLIHVQIVEKDIKNSGK